LEIADERIATFEDEWPCGAETRGLEESSRAIPISRTSRAARAAQGWSRRRELRMPSSMARRA